MIVFPMQNSRKLGMETAKKANAKTGKIETRKFPDCETYLRFLDDVRGREVALVDSMYPEPNEALVQLFFAGRTARELGARKVTAVIPYLGYMRQDKRFHEGECVSNHVMAHMLSQCIDKIITIDPHLHRVRNLADLFHIERKRLSANSAIAEHIRKRFSKKTAVIAGPDIESSQWAREIANSIGFESAIFTKERFGPRHVKINVAVELHWKNKEVIIVDDIVSSGHTMLEAVKEIRKRKPKAIHCICVHGIFAEGCYEKIKKAGAKSVVSSNTIAHESNAIDISGLIAEELIMK